MFNKESIIECYWAGFIAADGNLRSPDKKGNRKEIRMSCNIKDYTHLNKFKSFVDTNCNLRLNKNMCYLDFTNATIYNNLIKNFNITPRKSLTLKPPKGLNKKQSLAFIKGYIDGDGCISYRKDTQLRLSVVGTKQILKWVCKHLNIDNKIQICYNKKTYEVKVTGNKKARNILKTLKKLKTPSLARKWNKV